MAVPPQTPVVHLSLVVHAFPSLQVVPLLIAGLLHRPLDVSQVPAAWHWSSAPHVTELLPVQAPAMHVSTKVQAFPSAHVVPSFLTGLVHTPVPELHAPTP